MVSDDVEWPEDSRTWEVSFTVDSLLQSAEGSSNFGELQRGWWRVITNPREFYYNDIAPPTIQESASRGKTTTRSWVKVKDIASLKPYMS